jgi:hypothetical protein
MEIGCICPQHHDDSSIGISLTLNMNFGLKSDRSTDLVAQNFGQKASRNCDNSMGLERVTNNVGCQTF